MHPLNKAGRIDRLEFYKTATRNLGMIHTLRRQYQKRFSSGDMVLGSKQLDFPVSIRQNTSDLDVFDQILSFNEYRCLDGLELSGTIIDLGANVGFSSAYFLSNFPACSVIAVEPDPSNYKQLAKNLAPYAGRHKSFRAAVWPHREKLMFDPTWQSQGDEWGRKVAKVADHGAQEIETMSVPDLIALSGQDRIALLKIDIEGAETELFTHGAEQWLSKIDNMVIELHGDEAEQAFHRAISGRGYDISRCDELTVCLSARQS